MRLHTINHKLNAFIQDIKAETVSEFISVRTSAENSNNPKRAHRKTSRFSPWPCPALCQHQTGQDVAEEASQGSDAENHTLESISGEIKALIFICNNNEFNEHHVDLGGKVKAIF